MDRKLDASDFAIEHNTLTDGSYTVVRCDLGHDCGHGHKSWQAAERCRDAWIRRHNLRARAVMNEDVPTI